jgi:hypothetical protein
MGCKRGTAHAGTETSYPLPKIENAMLNESKTMAKDLGRKVLLPKRGVKATTSSDY